MEEADALCTEIIADVPDFIDALNLRAQIALQSSDQRPAKPELAIEYCEAAISLAPKDPRSHYLLASAQRRTGDAATAEESFKQALRLKPDFAEAAFEIGAIDEALGNLPDAAFHYERACEIRPGFLEAHQNLGAVYRRMGQTESAVAHGQIALALAHDNPLVRFSLGVSLEESGNHPAAIAEYREALHLRPGYIQAENNLGRLLDLAGEYREAVAILEGALQRSPDNVSLLTNLGNGYIRIGRHADAVALLERATTLEPGLAPAHNSLGAAYNTLGDTATAIRHYRQAIELRHTFAEAHENLAQALLQVGDFSSGWREYASRWKNPANSLTKREFKQPRWDGSPLADRTLLLHAEQGLGDTIQMVRFAALVVKQEGRIVFACQAPLIRLLQRIPAIDEIFELGEDWPEFDIHAPLFDLPEIFGTEKSNIPADTPYISVAKSESSGAEYPGNRLKVGIAWSGRSKFEEDPFRNRSCPLSHFTELSDIAEISLFSFQRAPQRQELILADSTGSIFDLGDINRDFEDDAAALLDMDIVICVDTALAHLAGAMNIPCWIVLPKSADWRWFEGIDRSPWYPSVRLFRQQTPGDWTHPFEEIKKRLAGVLLARAN